MSSGNVWSPFIFTVLLLKMHQYVANRKCLQKLSETVPDSNRIILLYNIEMRLITTVISITVVVNGVHHCAEFKLTLFDCFFS